MNEKQGLTTMKTETTTKTGNVITLKINNAGKIICTMHHPQYGTISGVGQWGRLKGREGVTVNAYVGKKWNNCLFEIERDVFTPFEIERDKIAAEKKVAKKMRDEQIRSEAIEMCPDGCVIARCLWSNGDLMSAEYQDESGTKAVASDLLENHFGWYFVPAELFEKAKADKKAKQKKRTAEQKAEQKRIDEIFDTAKKTGEKQLLRTFSIECQDPREECNTDIVTVWAMPDGSKTETVNHTW